MIEITTVNVGVEFFLPTDARHWIPNGFADVDLPVSAETLAIGEDWEWIEEIEIAAELWCERTHGKGSFSRVILEP
jgi:hypothetical protein